MDKMLADGYFDMSVYINARIHKDDMLAKLKKEKSKYIVLYQNSYPKSENAYHFWKEKLLDDYVDEREKQRLSNTESVAIVNWVYRILKNAEARVLFTKELFGKIKELHDIQRNIVYSQGVFYNKAKVDMHFFSSISGVTNFISGLTHSGELFLEDIQTLIICCFLLL